MHGVFLPECGEELQSTEVSSRRTPPPPPGVVHRGPHVDFHCFQQKLWDSRSRHAAASRGRVGCVSSAPGRPCSSSAELRAALGSCSQLRPPSPLAHVHACSRSFCTRRLLIRSWEACFRPPLRKAGCPLAGLANLGSGAGGEQSSTPPNPRPRHRELPFGRLSAEAAGRAQLTRGLGPAHTLGALLDGLSLQEPTARLGCSPEPNLESPGG